MPQKDAKPPADPAPNEQPDAKRKAKFLPGREPKAPPHDRFFVTTIEEIVVLQDRAIIGEVVSDAGRVLAQVRLATGLTFGQLIAAIRQGKAGEKVVESV